MEHCPDCYRFTLYTSLTLLLARSGRTTAFRTIMIFIVFFSSLIGLIKGESGCWDWIILGSGKFKKKKSQLENWLPFYSILFQSIDKYHSLTL